MILQTLKEYYDRKAADLPPVGWVSQRLDYAIVLARDGSFQQIDCLQETKGGKRERFPCTVPSIGKQALKHTNSGTDANLLWDNSSFVFGIGKKGTRKLDSFIATIKLWLGIANDEGVSAVLRFLESGQGSPAVFAPITEHREYGEDIGSGGPVLTFRVAGEEGFVFDRPVVKQAIAANWSRLTENMGAGICLITGDTDSIEPCHTVIKGVWKAQTSGATIVGFNDSAFRSFGKEQGKNAPVGKTAAFAYTTALNHLLRWDSTQKMQVGDATTVFWAAKTADSGFEDFFGELWTDDPDRNTKAVESLYRSAQTGVFATDLDTTRFYVLGLAAPSKARIGIRFWITDTVAGMAGKVRQHFQDLRISHGPRDRDTLSLIRLLSATAAQGKADNIPPNLAGDTMRAILEGLPYPTTLLQAAVRRNRAEHDVPYARAALIKASINRGTRFKHKEKEELHVSLDPNNPNIGYRLGRLFATLERTQREANPGINATIRDRFYGAASGTPVTVFPNLMRLKNHHLAKIESVGRRMSIEKLLGEIIDGIPGYPGFPPHLPLEDQGRFAIGYYHQMQAFFPKGSAKLSQAAVGGESDHE